MLSCKSSHLWETLEMKVKGGRGGGGGGGGGAWISGGNNVIRRK